MRVLILLIALSLAFAVSGQDKKVYKKVNEDGSITYTDSSPEENAEEMDLPELQVVPARKTTYSSTRSSNKKPEETPVYKNLRMVEPEPDQTYWGTGGTMSVQMATDEPLKEGYELRYYYDGVLISTSPSMTQILTEVFRGAHTVKAELIDPNGRVLSSAGPVTFHMKQQSIQSKNNRRG